MLTAKNPILPGFYPDPSICRVEDTYYLVNSTFSYAPGVPIFESRDLVNWKQIGNILDRREQLVLDGATMSRGIYAPTIRYHQGTFYMITTNVSYGGNFYVTAKDPAGPWSDPIYLKAPEGEDGGIDPSLYFEGEKCYYVGQRQKKAAEWFGDCEIWMQELDLQRGELTGPSYALYDGSMKKANWAEGPHLYKIGEYYYLLCAEQGTGFEHSISVARSRTLTGPYENYPGNPLLTHRHLGRQYPVQCVGHGDLVDTKEGDFYMVLLGTRPVNGAARLGRETFLAKVEWQEGWPVVNPGEGKLFMEQPVALPECPLAKGQVPAFQRKMELSFRQPLDPRILTFRHLREGAFKTADEQGCEIALSFRGGRPQDADREISYLGVRQQALCFSLRVQAGCNLNEGEEAGLLYLHDDDNYLLFLMKKGPQGLYCQVKKRELGKEEFFPVHPVIQEEDGFATMGLSGTEKGVIFELSETEIGSCSTDFLSSERGGGFVGCTYGIYAFGATEGYAHFRHFTVEYPVVAERKIEYNKDNAKQR